MDLILWRHAEAVDLELVGDDFERPLTSRGEKQADRMAHWLDRQLPAGARILASPTRRTEQTVMALGRKYKTQGVLSPLGTPAQLLELVQWPQAKGCVLVVGHQPTLGQTIAQLLGMDVAECSVKKGAVWWLRYRERGTPEQVQAQTTVLTVQAPDLL